jgi:hypothetical protein
MSKKSPKPGAASAPSASGAPGPSPRTEPGHEPDPGIVGLIANVYCPREPSPLGPMIDRWERFAADYEGRLRRYQDVLAPRSRPYKPALAGLARARIAHLPAERYKAWKAHSGGEDERFALPSFRAAVDSTKGLAHLRYGLAPGALGSPAEMLDWFRSFVRGLPVAHATFGLGMSDDWCLHEHRLVRRALLCRYLGLDYDTDDLVWAAKPWLRPPNWLTLLHPSYVEQLGGPEGFQRLEQLGLGIELHHWPEGLLIQAGPRPLLGDVNAGEGVEAYRAVARVLRPLRAPGPHTWIDQRPDGEADEWYARFD